MKETAEGRTPETMENCACVSSDLTSNIFLTVQFPQFPASFQVSSQVT